MGGFHVPVHENVCIWINGALICHLFLVVHSMFNSHCLFSDLKICFHELRVICALSP
jgi:hypothetical protein